MKWLKRLLLLNFCLLTIFSCRGPRFYYQFPISYNNHLSQIGDTTATEEAPQPLTVSTGTQIRHLPEPIPNFDRTQTPPRPKTSKEKRKELKRFISENKKKDETEKPKKKLRGFFGLGILTTLIGTVMIQYAIYYLGFLVFLSGIMMLAIFISEAGKRKKANRQPEEKAVEPEPEPEIKEPEITRDPDFVMPDEETIRKYRADAFNSMWFSILAFFTFFTVITPIISFIGSIVYNSKYKDFKKNLPEEGKSMRRLNTAAALSTISMIFAAGLLLLYISIITGGLLFA